MTQAFFTLNFPLAVVRRTIHLTNFDALDSLERELGEKLTFENLPRAVAKRIGDIFPGMGRPMRIFEDQSGFARWKKKFKVGGNSLGPRIWFVSRALLHS
jgi:hypothetical protein